MSPVPAVGVISGCGFVVAGCNPIGGSDSSFTVDSGGVGGLVDGGDVVVGVVAGAVASVAGVVAGRSVAAGASAVCPHATSISIRPAKPTWRRVGSPMLL